MDSLNIWVLGKGAGLGGEGCVCFSSCRDYYLPGRRP
jgi:hypothetical protein